MKTNTNKLGHARGFTLIELLVVIAIIGILASVVLASLNTARNKGADAAVKGALSQLRSQAELYYDGAGNYTALCADPAVSAILTNANANSAATAAIEPDYTDAGGDTFVTCHASATGYGAEAPLKGVVGSSMCVDSTGAAMVTAANLGASDIVCN